MNEKLIESLSHYPRNMTGYGSSSIHPHWPNKARVALQFVLSYEDFTATKLQRLSCQR